VNICTIFHITQEKRLKTLGEFTLHLTSSDPLATFEDAERCLSLYSYSGKETLKKQNSSLDFFK
jgi:hypothetical protein